MDKIIKKAMDYILENTDIGGTDLEIVEQAVEDVAKEVKESSIPPHTG